MRERKRDEVRLGELVREREKEESSREKRESRELSASNPKVRKK